MLPHPKDKSLAWLNFLNTYETCQWYILNVLRRSETLEEIKKVTKVWLRQAGYRERPFYSM